MKTWADFNITITGTGPEIYTTCPQCSPTRKKQNAKCLSANLEKEVWVCHHCGWAGTLKGGEEKKSRPFAWKPQVYRRPDFHRTPVTDVLREWFHERGIRDDIVKEHQISSQVVYFPQLEDRSAAIVFPYFRGDEVINCKYRGLTQKVFRQEFDAEKILYGLNGIGKDFLIIVEGEIDKLSFAQAGYNSCVSVPDGAPPEHSKPSEQKFEYLVNCKQYLDPLKKIVLAVDGDGPGKTLELELARRLGQERCYRVQWPEGCKDANDVLVKLGEQALRDVIEQAKPWPIDQTVRVNDIADDIIAMRTQPIPRGVSTGWTTLDQYYTVKPGEMTIVTGQPSHGKSEWMDALLTNLAMMQDWTFLICSPENLPLTRHVSKLIEKHERAPFFRRGDVVEMSNKQLINGLQFAHDHFFFIVPEESLTIDDVLAKARAFVFQHGIRGLLLDPWNEFDHRRKPGLSETEHIATTLGQLRRFGLMHEVHVWVVAHPAKMQRLDDGTYPVVRPYDISGSAHWFNRADNCLSVWRNPGAQVGDEAHNITTIHVQKVRNKYVGTVGAVNLEYVPQWGGFMECES